jgi:hypothetical protein
MSPARIPPSKSRWVAPAAAALLICLSWVEPPMAAADPQADCAADALLPEVGVRVENVSPALADLGLHEDFLLLRTESRLTSAGWRARPPRLQACRLLFVRVALGRVEDGSLAALISVNGHGLQKRLASGTLPTSLPVGASTGTTAFVLLGSDTSLRGRRETVERILATVAEQVDRALADAAESGTVDGQLVAHKPGER